MKSELIDKILGRLTSMEGHIKVIIKMLAAADYLAMEVQRDHDLGRLSIDSEDALRAYRDLRSSKGKSNGK